LRVALDGTPLTTPTGGVPRYVRELYRALQELEGDEEYLLVSDQPLPPGYEAAGPVPTGLLERRWWLAGLPLALRRMHVDVFHGTEFAVPYIPVCASVLSLHDLSPWKEAGWHGAQAERVRQRTPLLLRMGLATMVLTLSEAVRREAMEHFRLPPERGPAGEPYILYVGTIEPRKNVPLLVAAWRELRKRRRVRLVLAGRRREDGPEIAAEEGLELLGAVEESELAGLYSGAAVVAYPTLYEGFWLPVLEAMQCGAAVVTSRDAAVMEVAGGAALHCDADDAAAWVKALEDVLEKDALRGELREKGLRRAAEFTWARTARETRAVYAEALVRFGGRGARE
jgi:glycosyltransferase involved in cell wall biosynthesis